MGCPSPAELESFFDPGAPRDPARAHALLAHVRECPRCHEALRDDLAARLPAGAPARPEAPRSRGRSGPRPALVVLAGVGLAFLVSSRTVARRRHDVPVAGAGSPSL